MNQFFSHTVFISFDEIGGLAMLFSAQCVDLKKLEEHKL